jgi:hypothetical protein
MNKNEEKTRKNAKKCEKIEKSVKKCEKTLEIIL